MIKGTSVQANIVSALYCTAVSMTQLASSTRWQRLESKMCSGLEIRSEAVMYRSRNERQSISGLMTATTHYFAAFSARV